MKKTLIALMALAGAALADSDIWTLTTNGSGNAGGASACGIAFTLTGAPDRYTVTAPEESLTLPTSFQFELTSISFAGIQTENKNNTPGNVYSSWDYYLYITDSSCNVLGLSSTSVNIPKTATDVSFAITNTDGEALTLSSGTEYRAYFVHTERVDAAVSGGVLTPAEANGLIRDGSMLTNIPTSVSSAQWGLVNANGVISNTTYCYDATITGKVIPEPATASLSLLALAGLAARRRRK